MLKRTNNDDNITLFFILFFMFIGFSEEIENKFLIQGDADCSITQERA